MTKSKIIELAYNVRQKQKEYFKSYDRGVLAETKKLEKTLDAELECYFHPEKQIKQNDLFEI